MKKFNTIIFLSLFSLLMFVGCEVDRMNDDSIAQASFLPITQGGVDDKSCECSCLIHLSATKTELLSGNDYEFFSKSDLDNAGIGDVSDVVMSVYKQSVGTEWVQKDQYTDYFSTFDNCCGIEINPNQSGTWKVVVIGPCSN